MYFGEERNILGTWFRLHHTVNNGMAFGIEIMQGQAGKLFLTFFRLVLVGFGFWFLWTKLKENKPTGLIISIALIIAGAIGNVIDSVFYGVIFNEGSWFQGKVVDMLYFPLVEGHYPTWFPKWGGEEFVFFSPVFNLADAAISTGVIAILIWQKRFFNHINHFNSLAWNDDIFEKNTTAASAWFAENCDAEFLPNSRENFEKSMHWLKVEVSKELHNKKSFFTDHAAQKLYAYAACLGENLIANNNSYHWTSSEMVAHTPLSIQKEDEHPFALDHKINDFLFKKNQDQVILEIMTLWNTSEVNSEETE